LLQHEGHGLLQDLQAKRCVGFAAGKADVLIRAALQTVTKGMRGEINTALRDIRVVMPDVTADVMRRRATAYRQQWPKVTCSPSALAKHWGSLETAAKKEGGAPPAVENLCPAEFEAACLDLYGRVPGPWALLGIAEQADIRAWCEKERGAGE